VSFSLFFKGDKRFCKVELKFAVKTGYVVILDEVQDPNKRFFASVQNVNFGEIENLQICKAYGLKLTAN
jgi:hypothetical protein